MADKTTKNGPETTRRAFPCSVRQVPGMDRVLRFTASTEEVARDGDIVRVAGWETENFEKNPVFLWSHDHEVPPIGRVIKTKKIAKPKDGTGPRLEIDVEFAGMEQLHDLAESVYLLYRDGFLRAVSVGFMPLEYQDLTDDQRGKLGLGPYGRVIKRADLWEVSAVTVPADVSALMIEGDEDRAAVKSALLCVRSAVPEPDRAAFDAAAEALDAAPEPEPVPDPTLRDVIDELRSLRAFVEERLPVQRQTPDDPPPPPHADEPEAPPPPPPPAPRAASDGDIYGLIEAIQNRKKKEQ